MVRVKMKYINNLKGNLKILVSLQTGANIIKVNKIEVNKIKINSVCLNNDVYRCFSCSSYVEFVGGLLSPNGGSRGGAEGGGRKQALRAYLKVIFKGGRELPPP